MCLLLVGGGPLEDAFDLFVPHVLLASGIHAGLKLFKGHVSEDERAFAFGSVVLDELFVLISFASAAGLEGVSFGHWGVHGVWFEGGTGAGLEVLDLVGSELEFWLLRIVFEDLVDDFLAHGADADGFLSTGPVVEGEQLWSSFHPFGTDNGWVGECGECDESL